jgi:ATP-dependent DNA helicase RecG
LSPNRTPEYLTGLVHELRKLPKETEWVEFKENNIDPDEIGQSISALSNSAALLGKAFAYIIWGINDSTHELVGVNFALKSLKVGNEEYENWLLHLLEPKIDFHFFSVSIDGKEIVILEIGRAFRHPVRFKSDAYVRVGSYTKKLKSHPEKERELWRIFDQTPFEELIAGEDLTGNDVLGLLDYPAYFDLFKLPLPEAREGIFLSLEQDRLIVRNERNNWNISNLGAILFAKKLNDFRSLKRKAVRVIVYKGNSRVETIREQEGSKGYASGFDGLMNYINGLLPSNEIIQQALRKTVPVYPPLAVRELVANALIHQDFFLTGTGPMIELFENRLEIRNPGAPLVDIARLVDTQPRSRNDALASLMRRVGICEERGSGWDKIVFQTEFYQLPAPLAEAGEDYTCVTMFSPKPLSKMDRSDRVRACYLHSCLRWVMRDPMTNATLRGRFGIEEKNKATVSRYIKEALQAHAIKPFDDGASKKMKKYVPWWA